MHSCKGTEFYLKCLWLWKDHRTFQKLADRGYGSIQPLEEVQCSSFSVVQQARVSWASMAAFLLAWRICLSFRGKYLPKFNSKQSVDSQWHITVCFQCPPLSSQHVLQPLWGALPQNLWGWKNKDHWLGHISTNVAGMHNSQGKSADQHPPWK